MVLFQRVCGLHGNQSGLVYLMDVYLMEPPLIRTNYYNLIKGTVKGVSIYVEFPRISFMK